MRPVRCVGAQLNLHQRWIEYGAHQANQRKKCIATVLHDGTARQGKHLSPPTSQRASVCQCASRADADRMRVVGALVQQIGEARGCTTLPAKRCVIFSRFPLLRRSKAAIIRGRRRSFVAAAALHFGGVKRRNLSFLFFSSSSLFFFIQKLSPQSKTADPSLWGCVGTYAPSFFLICQYRKKGICP